MPWNIQEPTQHQGAAGHLLFTLELLDPGLCSQAHPLVLLGRWVWNAFHVSFPPGGVAEASVGPAQAAAARTFTRQWLVIPS